MKRTQDPEGFNEKTDKPTLYGVDVEPGEWLAVKPIAYALAGRLDNGATLRDFADAVEYAKTVVRQWDGVADAKAARRGVRIIR